MLLFSFQMTLSTGLISSVSNLNVLHSAFVLRQGIVTAIPPGHKVRAMCCRKYSEIDNSLVMAGVEWLLRTNSALLILF